MTEFDIEQHRDEDAPAFVGRFYSALKATGRFYRSDEGNPLFIEDGGGTEIVSPADMVPKVHSVLSPFKEVQTRAGSSYKERCTIPPGAFTLFFNHERVNLLDPIDAVVTAPVLFLKGGAWNVSTPGYNRGDNVRLYHAGSVIAPRSTTTYLKTFLEKPAFDSPGYRANTLAYLLSLVVVDRYIAPPILVVDGNNCGVGKTSLVDALGIISDGKAVRRLTSRGAELIKQIGAALLNKERFMLLDNVARQSSRGFDHAEFSQITTGDFSKATRLLGQNKFVSGNGLHFSMTLNDAKLSDDIASRALNVFLNADKFVLTEVPHRDYAEQNREALYGELLGLGLRAAGAYTPPPPAFRFRPWAHFVAPRVEPEFGPLLLVPPRAVDEIGVELSHFLSEVEAEFPASRLVSAVLARPEHYSSISERLAGGTGSAHSQQSIAGRLLTAFCNKVFETETGEQKVLRRTSDSYRLEDAT